MDMLELYLPDESATARLGARVAALLAPGDIVCLSGPLGAGKTALARAIIAELTAEANAPSPTFGLAAVYDAGRFDLWHFDMYRLERPEDAWELGIEEAFDSGVSLIEWAERIESILPEDVCLIRLAMDGPGRRASLSGAGDWPARLDALIRSGDTE